MNNMMVDERARIFIGPVLVRRFGNGRPQGASRHRFGRNGFVQRLGQPSIVRRTVRQDDQNRETVQVSPLFVQRRQESKHALKRLSAF